MNTARQIFGAVLAAGALATIATFHNSPSVQSPPQPIEATRKADSLTRPESVTQEFADLPKSVRTVPVTRQAAPSPTPPAHQLRWSPAPRPPFGRQRRHAPRPDRGVRSRAGDVAQSQRRDIRTQIGLGAIAGVHQDHPARKAGSHAQRSCSSAISGLILKLISSGTPALRRRLRSCAQSCGKYCR